MVGSFDPYHLWLGIPPEEQPPNHYRLLGVKLFEQSADVIESAADRQMSLVRSFQTGKHAAESQQLLNSLAAARFCLSDADKKASYDAQLRAALAKRAAALTPPIAPVAAKPMQVAKALPARVAAPLSSVAPATTAGGLDFDPLAESTAPRARRQKRASQFPPLIFAAGAAGLLAIAGAVWVVTASNDSPTPLSATAKKAPESKPPADLPSASQNVAFNDSEPPAHRAELRDSRNGKAKPPKSKPSARKARVGSAGSTVSDEDAPPNDAAESADMEPGNDAVFDSAGDADTGRNSAEEVAIVRAVPPDATTVDAATLEVKQLFKAEYAAAKKPAERAALAEKLLKLAGESETPAEQYALFAEARRLALSAGDSALTLQAIELLTGRYDLQRFELAAAAIEELTDKTAVVSAPAELVELTLPLIDQAQAAGQIAPARRMVVAVLPLARKAKLDSTKTLAARGKELVEAERLAAEADAARLALAKDPGDAAAHLTLGKYLCFVLDDWPAGLDQFKAGSEPALQALAEQDLAGAKTVAKRVKLGDAWWDLAETAKGLDAEHWQGRACHWYRLAGSELTGLTKAKVESRLAQVAPKLAFAPKLSGAVSPRTSTADNTLTAKPSAGKQVVFLSRLPAFGVELWGDSKLEAPVSVAGEFSPHGLSVHPRDNSDAHVAYELRGKYRTLAGSAAINDTVATTTGNKRTFTPLIFRIVADGKTLWTSRPLGLAGESEAFEVSVAGKGKLELIVDCSGSAGAAHAVWVEPRLTLGRDTATPPANPVAASPVPVPAAGDLLHGALLIVTFDDATILRKPGELHVRDVSGKQKPGLVAGATLVPGKIGRALKLDTAGQHVDWGDAAALNPRLMTACAWIRPAAHDNEYTDIFSKHNDDRGHSGFVLRLHWNAPTFTMGTGDGNWYGLQGPATVPLDEWTHLAATCDGRTRIVYVNGQEAAIERAAGPVAASTQRCFVGSSSERDDMQFFGLIDEVALFDRAISAAEVEALYQLGVDGKSLSSARAPRAAKPAGTPKPAR